MDNTVLYKTLAQLIMETENTDELVYRIKQIINETYFKNSNVLPLHDVLTLYEWEECKRFYMGFDEMIKKILSPS